MKNKNDNNLIGNRIRLAREKAGLTQNRLHEMTGISITQISAYENNKRKIGLNSLKKIADATGTTMDAIYSGNAENKPVSSSLNEGKLIINCVNALFEHKVITSVVTTTSATNIRTIVNNKYSIGFCNYQNILNDFIRKMVDFNTQKDYYPNPTDFKNQLMEAAAKQINDVIQSKQKINSLGFTI